MANDEAALNVRLADVLRPKNPAWRVSAHELGALSGGRQPDILVRSPGLAPVILEVEYDPASTVESEAKGRLRELVRPDSASVENTIAVAAPVRLREVEPESLARALQTSEFRFCLHSVEDEGIETRWPKQGWLHGDANYLAELIENAAVSERRLARSLDILQAGVSQAAARLEQFLPATGGFGAAIARQLHQEESEQTLRMAMAIVANALSFQTSLQGPGSGTTFDSARSHGTVINHRITNEWRRILREVNYLPIFKIALQIMIQIPPRAASSALTRLVEVAEELAGHGLTSSHDLTGRMFQRLIADRKFLATFYTRPESAALLADLAAGMLNVDFSDREQLLALRVADLACGTGTLLAAQYSALRSRFRHAGNDDAELHKAMLESVLVGGDIMPAATHLTASMLASAHPNITIEDTQVFTLPYGTYSKTRTAIGSLDLIRSQFGRDLFGTGMTVHAGRESEEETQFVHERFSLPHESLDLAIMNPPFTRPTNHKLTGVPVPSFAGFGTSSDEQRAMAQILAEIRGECTHPVAGHGNAGIASNFVDLAHVKLKPGGVLALVMPLSIVQGSAWAACRQLLKSRYRDLVVVTIAAAREHDKSFSADTGLGEALLLGRKLPAGARSDEEAIFVNLLRRPTTGNEAVQIARSIRAFERSDAGSGDIRIGDAVTGNLIEGKLDEGGLAGVADRELALASRSLRSGLLTVTGYPGAVEFPVCRLGELGQRGLVHRDINGRNSDGSARGPFDIETIRGRPAFPALWTHSSGRQRTLRVEPDSMGVVRPGMEEKAEEVWGSATRLHLNVGFRLNSQSLAACLTRNPTIGGRGWPNYRTADPRWEDLVLLWLNSTLGLIEMWWSGNRQQAGRASLTISQLPDLRLLDPRSLSQPQLAATNGLADRLSNMQFLPANEAYCDKVRHLLDETLYGEILGYESSTLQLIALLREKWCAEPSVHGSKRTRPDWSF